MNAKESPRCRQVFVVTKFVISGTQCSKKRDCTIYQNLQELVIAVGILIETIIPNLRFHAAL